MLKTVRVPDKFVPLFEQAQQYVPATSPTRRPPERGTLEIAASATCSCARRRCRSSSTRWSGAIYGEDREAVAVAQSLLFDVAHAMGHADARAFAERMERDAIPSRDSRPAPCTSHTRAGLSSTFRPRASPRPTKTTTFSTTIPIRSSPTRGSTPTSRRFAGVHDERRLLVGLVRAQLRTAARRGRDPVPGQGRRGVPVHHGSGRTHRRAHRALRPAPSRARSAHRATTRSRASSATRTDQQLLAHQPRARASRTTTRSRELAIINEQLKRDIVERKRTEAALSASHRAERATDRERCRAASCT